MVTREGFAQFVRVHFANRMRSVRIFGSRESPGLPFLSTPNRTNIEPSSVCSSPTELLRSRNAHLVRLPHYVRWPQKKKSTCSLPASNRRRTSSPKRIDRSFAPTPDESRYRTGGLNAVKTVIPKSTRRPGRAL
jgi:hypothetical protein